MAYRELIIASRKKSTFWLRASVTAAGFMMCLMLLSANIAAADAGLTAFRLVTGLAFAYALLSGLWLTADCLSAERREETLPLLYLTRMGRWELILSKLAGSSLRGFYGLIAVLPVAAVPVMAGGVTGREQWQVPVVLVVTMIFSLSAGMLASAVCREEEKAQALTAALTLIPTATGTLGALILIPLILSRVQHAGGKRHLLWLSDILVLAPLSIYAVLRTGHLLAGSPAFAWYAAMGGKTDAVVASILPVGAMAEFFFCLAGFAIDWGPGRGEGVADEVQSENAVSQKSQTGFSAPHAVKKKTAPVGNRPVEWLLKRTAHGTGLALAAAILMAMPSIFGAFGIPLNSVRGAMLIGWWAMIPSVFLAFVVARYAARGLAVMRQSGFIEVVLSTPVQLSGIVAAQKRVFWRDMRWVLAVVIFSELFPWIRYLVELMGAGPNLHMEPFGFVYGVVSVVQTFIYFAALLWLGMYFGYAKRKVAVAAGWTVLCVLILPMFARSLFSIMWMRLPGGGAPQWIYYAISLLSFLVSVSIYLGLIRWARIKLLGKLKEQKGTRVLRGWLSPRMTAKEL